MPANNKTRQAAFKQRMRLAGKKQITIWVTPEEEQSVRGLLGKDVSALPAEIPSAAKLAKKKLASPSPVRQKPVIKSVRPLQKA